MICPMKNDSCKEIHERKPIGLLKQSRNNEGDCFSWWPEMLLEIYNFLHQKENALVPTGIQAIHLK